MNVVTATLYLILITIILLNLILSAGKILYGENSIVSYLSLTFDVSFLCVLILSLIFAIKTK